MDGGESVNAQLLVVLCHVVDLLLLTQVMFQGGVDFVVRTNFSFGHGGCKLRPTECAKRVC
jgi:hypothetical protein